MAVPDEDEKAAPDELCAPVLDDNELPLVDDEPPPLLLPPGEEEEEGAPEAVAPDDDDDDDDNDDEAETDTEVDDDAPRDDEETSEEVELLDPAPVLVVDDAAFPGDDDAPRRHSPAAVSQVAPGRIAQSSSRSHA